MTVTLQKLNKSNGQVLTQEDLAKVDSNSNIIQETLNNLPINFGNTVTTSTINGNIKIDGVETVVYTHPTGTSATNPHNTTATDVGLGNVTNESKTTMFTNPTFIGKVAEGENVNASGINSHSEGEGTTASGNISHAEGAHTIASGNISHAEGAYTIASGTVAHAEGNHTVASGSWSHSQGSYTTASGSNSHSEGIYTQARYLQHTMGRYNTISATTDTEYLATGEAFIIGNGTDTSTRGNAFKVMFNGLTYADGTYASTGADYAEYFEWTDANIDNEDRVGYFVTLNEEKIRKATSMDDYILGIVSATPSVVGDNYESWQDKYVTDEFGRIQYHDVIIPATYETIDGKQIIIQEEHIDKHPIYNSNWDSSQEYISRENRPEWSPVGMMGKLLVRDDGTCEVNGYCKPNDSGIATKSDTGYRVMKRVSDNIIQVLFR